MLPPQNTTVEILQVPHHVLGGKWLLQVLGKHLQGSSSGVKPYFHIKLFHSRSFKVRCFFKQTLIKSLLVSHQGGNISFLFTGAHLLPEIYRLAIHLLSEKGVFFLCHELPAKMSSPAWNTTCPETITERFGFPAQHLLPQILPMKP